LTPSAEEREQEYYQRLNKREDIVDEVIDHLTMFLVGDVMLHSSVVKEADHRPRPVASSPPVTMTHDTIPGAFTTCIAPQTHGPTIETLTPIDSQAHGSMPTTSTSFAAPSRGQQDHSLEMFHLFDRRFGEHEDEIQSLDDCPYMTPPTPIHEGVSYVELGDEIVKYGQQLKRKKRSQALIAPFLEWPKRVKFTRSEHLTFDPFRHPCENDQQAFWRWFKGETKGSLTIRCGLALQNRQFFEIMLRKGAYINSEVSYYSFVIIKYMSSL